jgi:hypothetical protein
VEVVGDDLRLDAEHLEVQGEVGAERAVGALVDEIAEVR